jgi:S-(hydroxymethyl)glutathione dehydrogenase/alcohol dehydrogenase
VTYGSNVVVVGCGAIGLSVIQSASLRGPARVIAVDRDPKRLAQARLFGATDLVEASSDALASVRALTAGRGADFSFEAAGNEAAMRFAVEAARPGGHVLLLGKVQADQDVAFRWASLTGEKQLKRSSYGGVRPDRDFTLLAQAYLDGSLKLDELISERLPLEAINDGYVSIEQGRSIRSVITFDGE